MYQQVAQNYGLVLCGVNDKDQVAFPSVFWKKPGIEEGDRVVFEETEEGLVVKLAADLEHSAGPMSCFAGSGDSRPAH